ncbi:hypothetical protein BZA05DRAFT_394177 [Tricharina praecox]|uniref:uncharacterized protein n=1 Tax=Tricharina praecox TaxID=43433 RepID=UPI00221EAF43|nr:uncharacterized protein BZA05DRAFT_394177 [Tricharina praecox]KAI5854422.1 hypothetical protein BZA05DRAFT_394177 [Tricharina praecox]
MDGMDGSYVRYGSYPGTVITAMIYTRLRLTSPGSPNLTTPFLARTPFPALSCQRPPPSSALPSPHHPPHLPPSPHHPQPPTNPRTTTTMSEKPTIPLTTPGSTLGFDPAVLAFGADGKIVSQQQQMGGGGSLEAQQRRLEELQREVVERERRLRVREKERERGVGVAGVEGGEE